MAANELHGRAMASALHIIALGGPDDLCVAGQQYVDHLERRWSRFIGSSDVSRLNLSEGRPTVVAPETMTLVATMVDGWRLTDGAYDPSILHTLIANGYAASKLDPEQRTVLPPSTGPSGSLAEIVLDGFGEMITMPPGLALDPGGIGKGLAADLTVAWMLQQGAGGALVSIGGDLSMAGEPPHREGWVVAVEQADEADGVLCSLAVSGGGVATSSTVTRRWVSDGIRRHHLIDPATDMQSATDLAAVTVIALTGWSAEVHATAALLRGSTGVLAYLERHSLSGIAQTTRGAVLLTDDLAGLGLLSGAGA